jgi:hypothetical protein
MTEDQFAAVKNLGPHVFYELGGGHVLLTAKVPDRHVVLVREQIPLDCMFELRRIQATDGVDSVVNIGYYFSSQFKVINNGGHIVTFLETKRGTAEKSEILIKSEDLVVIHFPNRGTMVISPALDDHTRLIFEEQ